MPEKWKRAEISVEKVWRKSERKQGAQELVEKRKDKNKDEKKMENET